MSLERPKKAMQRLHSLPKPVHEVSLHPLSSLRHWKDKCWWVQNFKHQLWGFWKLHLCRNSWLRDVQSLIFSTLLQLTLTCQIKKKKKPSTILWVYPIPVLNFFLCANKYRLGLLNHMRRRIYAHKLKLLTGGPVKINPFFKSKESQSYNLVIWEFRITLG